MNDLMWYYQLWHVLLNLSATLHKEKREQGCCRGSRLLAILHCMRLHQTPNDNLPKISNKLRNGWIRTTNITHVFITGVFRFLKAVALMKLQAVAGNRQPDEKKNLRLELLIKIYHYRNVYLMDERLDFSSHLIVFALVSTAAIGRRSINQTQLQVIINHKCLAVTYWESEMYCVNVCAHKNSANIQMAFLCSRIVVFHSLFHSTFMPSGTFPKHITYGADTCGIEKKYIVYTYNTGLSHIQMVAPNCRPHKSECNKMTL